MHSPYDMLEQRYIMSYKASVCGQTHNPFTITAFISDVARALIMLRARDKEKSFLIQF